MKLGHEQGYTKRLLDWHDMSEACNRIRYGCLKQDISHDIAHDIAHDISHDIYRDTPREQQPRDLIHISLTEEELADLGTATQPTCAMHIRAFLRDLPCLVMDITGNHHAFRLTLPLWQPRVASWLKAMDNDELVLVLSQEGLSSRRVRAELGICAAFKKQLHHAHQRTCVPDTYQSTDWMVQSGLMSMIQAEGDHESGKPLRHSVIAKPDVEALILDAFRISALLFQQGDGATLATAGLLKDYPHEVP